MNGGEGHMTLHTAGHVPCTIPVSSLKSFCVCVCVHAPDTHCIRKTQHKQDPSTQGSSCPEEEDAVTYHTASGIFHGTLGRAKVGNVTAVDTFSSHRCPPASL